MNHHTILNEETGRVPETLRCERTFKDGKKSGDFCIAGSGMSAYAQGRCPHCGDEVLSRTVRQVVTL